jgi:hypothetical protein
MRKALKSRAEFEFLDAPFKVGDRGRRPAVEPGPPPPPAPPPAPRGRCCAGRPLVNGAACLDGPLLGGPLLRAARGKLQRPALAAPQAADAVTPEQLAQFGGGSGGLTWFKWRDAAPGKRPSQSTQYQDFEATYECMASGLRRHSPDGLLGFSQGATAAALLLAQLAERQAEGRDLDVRPPRFAILVRGGAGARHPLGFGFGAGWPRPGLGPGPGAPPRGRNGFEGGGGLPRAERAPTQGRCGRPKRRAGLPPAGHHAPRPLGQPGEPSKPPRPPPPPASAPASCPATPPTPRCWSARASRCRRCLSSATQTPWCPPSARSSWPPRLTPPRRRSCGTRARTCCRRAAAP